MTNNIRFDRAPLDNIALRRYRPPERDALGRRCLPTVGDIERIRLALDGRWSRNTIWRWGNEGLRISVAEDVADVLELHPEEIWPGYWDAILNATSHREDDEPDRSTSRPAA